MTTDPVGFFGFPYSEATVDATTYNYWASGGTGGPTTTMTATSTTSVPTVAVSDLAYPLNMFLF